MTPADIAEILARYDVNPAAEALRTPQEAQAAADVRALAEGLRALQDVADHVRAWSEVPGVGPALEQARLWEAAAIRAQRERDAARADHDEALAEVERLRAAYSQMHRRAWKAERYAEDAFVDVLKADGEAERLKSATLAPETVEVLKRALAVCQLSPLKPRLLPRSQRLDRVVRAWVEAGCPDLPPE